MKPDFWLGSGHHLIDRRADARLEVTDDFMRALLARPEIAPVEESCAAELALHRALLASPRAEVGPERLTALADPDARENYAVWLDYRSRLLARDTLEDAYLALVRGGTGRVPALFLDQLVHLILRTILDGCDDPVRLRAAELLFRPQRVHLSDGRVLVADEETVNQRARQGGGEAELDVMTGENAQEYWNRSDRFDMALEVGFPQPGLDALCRVLEAWVKHLLGVAVRIVPVRRIDDERWAWHVGLDGESAAIMNALYAGETVAEATLTRVLALFRLEFDDPADMLPRIAGRPVHLAMAMAADGRLRLKPQNLLVNLPLTISGVPA